MIRELLVAGLCFVVQVTCNAQDNCSLRVRVLSPQGRAAYAVVTLQEQSGRETQQDYKGKDLEFCDLGILPVTVTAHLDPSCNEVSVRNVFVSPDKSYLLKIIYDPKDCSPDGLPLSRACDLLIRVRDSGGKYVSNASVHIRKPKDSTVRTDRYGRLLVAGGIGAPVAGSVTAPGFALAEFSFTCNGYDPQEGLVELRAVK